MKTLRSVIGLAAVGALAAGAFGCFDSNVPVETMTTGASVPSSEGTIMAKAGKNNNTELTVSVKRLAPAAKLAADSSVYVVWVLPPQGPIQNVGALSIDKDLTGSLDTVTPYDHFKVMVTPEPNAQVSAPSHSSVLTSDTVTKH